MERIRVAKGAAAAGAEIVKFDLFKLVENYKNTLTRFVGPAETFVSGNILQLKDYSKTDWTWTMFNPDDKIQRHETVFPEECKKVFEMGKRIFQ